ncbi:MAG TPA: flavodoxin domain-containing protein [Candidatus Aquicultor sp.]|jgi:menaquinone-dependent protoporphyrinogen IX oxidase
MKALVIFDSTFGNTQKIAETIAKELDTKAVPVSKVATKELNDLDLIVVGSPIISWKPSESMGKFLASLGRDQMKNVKAAAFDTRIRLFVHGDAATKISQALAEAGAEIVTEPQAFKVRGTEGPLLGGEIEKAVDWAKLIKTKVGK